MILPYQKLVELGRAGKLVDPYDEALVNPASIDIRIGKELVYNGDTYNLEGYTETSPFILESHEFILVATLERLKVPIDCAMDLRLKSSRARVGYDHALAFWFDPGWDGIGTMEIINNSSWPLPIYPGLRIGQVIYHRLTEPCEKPYQGRYQSASSVEGAKHGN